MLRVLLIVLFLLFWLLAGSIVWKIWRGPKKRLTEIFPFPLGEEGVKIRQALHLLEEISDHIRANRLRAASSAYEGMCALEDLPKIREIRGQSLVKLVNACNAIRDMNQAEAFFDKLINLGKEKVLLSMQTEAALMLALSYSKSEQYSQALKMIDTLESLDDNETLSEVCKDARARINEVQSRSF